MTAMPSTAQRLADTRACLKALERNGRRPLPSGLGGPSDDPERSPRPGLLETPWLQPAPDVMFGTAPADPATVVETRLVPTTVNGQPAFGSHARDHTGRYRPHAVQVLSTARTGITHIVAFLDPRLFSLCRLPPSPPG